MRRLPPAHLLVLGALVAPLVAPLDAADPTVRSTAVDFEKTATSFVARARREERALHFGDARGWYRAAAACYRYVVLPLRLAELDFLRATRGLRPSDLELPDFAEKLIAKEPELLQADYFELRERVVADLEHKAETALRRARWVAARLDTRSMGLVPIEPETPRRSVETILDKLNSPALRRALFVRDEEDATGGHPLHHAEMLEWSSRVLESTAVAFCRKQDDSLRRSTDFEIKKHSRARLDTVERALMRAEHEAAEAYARAAASFESDGRIMRALVCTKRANELRAKRLGTKGNTLRP